MGTRGLIRLGRLGLLCGLAAFLAGEAGWLAGVDARAYDLGLRTRPPLNGASNIAVVEISDASTQRLGRWPWPWSQHAEFVRALHEHYHPRAIVFDLLFVEPDSREEEAKLARAIEEAGNVYLAAFFSSVPQGGGQQEKGETPWLVGEYVGRPEWPGKSFASLSPPAAGLAAAAAGVGPVNVIPELDGSIRRLPLVLDYRNSPYVSLTGVVLNALVNPERGPVRVRLGEAVDFGGFRVPIEDTGETLISYARSAGGGLRQAFPHYQYESVLSQSVQPEALRDKVVLVGFSAAGMADVHPTPLASGGLGVDVNAHALNGLLQRRFLRVAGWPARLAFTLALGLLVSLVARSWSPAGALAITLVLAAWGFGLSAFVLWWRGIWIGAAVPGLAAIGAYTLTVVARYRESERDSLRRQASVETLAQATRVIASVRLRSELISEIRAQITDAMAARQTNLYLMDGGGERLELATPAPRSPEATGVAASQGGLATGEGKEGLSYHVGEGTVGWVASHGMAHLVRKVGAGSRLSRELARSVRLAVGSVAYAPMQHRGEVMGVVEVVRGAGEAPLEADHLGVLRALANEAAVALRNVALYEQLEGKVEVANRQLVGAYGEVRQERDRVAAMVSNMADGVLLTDAERRIVLMNPAAAQMFGVDAAAAEGRPAGEVLPYPALLEQLEDRPGPAATSIPRIRLEQPRRLVLSPRTVVLTDEGGGRRGAVSVVSDITLLEELSEMKTEFVSLVSHELRTPLTSIMGFAQTLRADTDRLARKDRDEFLGIIEQESYRLLVMINDLLDISRMEAGRPLAMRYTEVDLRGLAEHVVRFQRVTTNAHDFRLAFPEEGIRVDADRDKVEQMLTNLVSNAIKYSPRGGAIVVGAAEQDAEVVVSVRDQGVGMGPEEVARLFERYQRVDRDAIKGIRGTGLGLYLVRGLAEAHAGRVWVESEPGRGSTFHFSLPKRRVEREAAV